MVEKKGVQEARKGQRRPYVAPTVEARKLSEAVLGPGGSLEDALGIQAQPDFRPTGGPNPAERG